MRCAALVGIKAGNDTPVIRFVGTPVAASTIGSAGTFPINRYQTDHQFVYNLSAVLGSRHFFKAGTDIRRQQLDDVADNFSRGFYNFNAVCNGVNYGTAYAAMLNGCIATYQKGYGPFFLENRLGDSNVYAEDNWKLKPNFTFTLGARYEYVRVPHEIKGRVDYGFQNDKNNIEPRIALAYSPKWEGGVLGWLAGGAGQSSVRAGYGIFHGRLFQSVFSQSGATVRFNPPNAELRSFTNQNNLADPTNGYVFTPGTLPTTRFSFTQIDPDLGMPYTQQWNLTLERQLPFKSALRVSYSGNRGIGFTRITTGNLPVSPLFQTVVVPNHPNNAPDVLYTAANRPAGDPRAVDVRGQTLRIAADPVCAGTGLAGIPTNATCPVAVPIAANEISLRVPRTNERRPDGRYSSTVIISPTAWSYYHGLQVEWNKKLSHGLFAQASYTWSKALDTNSEATSFGTGDSNNNGPDLRSARALSRFHTPHRLTLFTSYTLPWFARERDWRGQVLGGWKLSLVAKLVHGSPFTVSNGTSYGDFNFDGFGESRPALVDPSVLGRTINNPLTSRTDLPREAFRTPVLADYNCCVLGRNTFYFDGVNNFDLGLFKTFRVPRTEKHQIVFRADMFNAFNHVQFGLPTVDLANANFMQIVNTSNTYNPRNVQFSLRYTF